MNIGTDRSASSSSSRPQVPKSIRPLRRDLSSFLGAYLQNRTGVPASGASQGGNQTWGGGWNPSSGWGGSGGGGGFGSGGGGVDPQRYAGANFDIFTNPGGTIGKAYENLWGGGGEDYLGARQAMQSVLSGRGFQDAYETGWQNLLPSTMAAINQGSNAIRGKAGVSGLRFSTDLNNQIGRFAGDQMLGLQQGALQAAAPIYQQRAQQASGIYDLISSLAQQDLGRQLPLLLQFATGFAPVGGSSSSSSSGWQAGVK